jgi:hypothetical protein
MLARDVPHDACVSWVAANINTLPVLTPLQALQVAGDAKKWLIMLECVHFSAVCTSVRPSELLAFWSLAKTWGMPRASARGAQAHAAAVLSSPSANQ